MVNIKPQELTFPTELTGVTAQLKTWVKLQRFLRVLGNTLVWDPHSKQSTKIPNFAEFQTYYSLVSDKSFSN